MEEKEDSGGLGSKTVVPMYKDISQFNIYIYIYIQYKILKYKTHHQLKIYEIKKKRKLG